jgi:cobalt/nickel transport system permease protein
MSGMAEGLAPLWAMHISDGVLTFPWLAGGFILAGLLAAVAAYRIRDEEIPRVALLTAAFFVASLMHVKLGPTSVHLLLCGLVGIVLGRRAPLALLVALGLQAALLQHGGLYTLGVNTCVVALPALLSAGLFTLLSRPARSRRPPMPFLLGFLVGSLAVLTTACLNAAVLLLGGAADWHSIVVLVFLAHLPLAPLEGVVLGFTVSFLARVKPEMLAWGSAGQMPAWDTADRHWQPAPPADAGIMTEEQRTGVEPGPSRPSSLAATHPPVLLMALAAGLLFASTARAHRLKADHEVLPDHKVRIESYFDLTGDSPHGARVQVFAADGSLLQEGKADDNGVFQFDYDRPQTLKVVVSAGAGHTCELVIDATELGGEGAAVPAPARERSTAMPWRDVLAGVSAVLAAAAFLMSWRTMQRLKQLTAAGEPRHSAEPPMAPEPR